MTEDLEQMRKTALDAMQDAALARFQASQARSELAAAARENAELRAEMERLKCGGIEHSDDEYAIRFSKAMREKLKRKREQGYGGWDSPDACSVERLADMLMQHLKLEKDVP